MSPSNFHTRSITKPRSTKARAIIVALCALLSACAKDATQNSANSTQTNSASAVVATVDGRVISAKLYEMFLKNGREELGIDETTTEGKRALEKLREGIVAELIDRALIASEAERRGLRVTDEMIDERERRERAGNDEKFDANLRAQGLTREEYRGVLRDELYGELMRAEASKSISVSDEEITKYYDEHKGDPEFQQPERIAASHVLVAARATQVAAQLQQERRLSGASLDAAVREELERRRQKAEDLRRRAATGANFAALARENSDDPATKTRGGDLGVFARDSHTRAFDEAAFALKVGEISQVVQTEYGFHVIKLNRREPARALTFEEAAPDVRKQLLAAKQSQVLKDWLDAARHRAQVRVSDPYRLGDLKNQYPAM
jgi:parvulin-like peptidyl-prolyl isomerase